MSSVIQIYRIKLESNSVERIVMEQLSDTRISLEKHIQGFTVFPQTFDETWMQRAREIFEETVNRIPYEGDTPQQI